MIPEDFPEKLSKFYDLPDEFYKTLIDSLESGVYLVDRFGNKELLGELKNGRCFPRRLRRIYLLFACQTVISITIIVVLVFLL